jgi:hypothetical protein
VKGVSVEAASAHELAHAYLAKHYSIPFTTVTIKQQGNNVTGFVQLAGNEIDTENQAIGMLVMYMSGHIGAETWMSNTGEKWIFTGSGDEAEFHRQCALYEKDWPDNWAHIPSLGEAQDLARGLVHQYWNQIVSKIPDLISAGNLGPGVL